MKGRVLVVDDDASMCDMLVSDLGELGFEVKARTAAPAALEALVASEFDAVVADLNMPGMSGLELCERIVASRPDVPVIVITAFGSIQTAIAAIRSGAYDFVTKPLEVDALALALERAIQHRALREEVRRLRQVVEETRRFGALLGTSPAMRRVYELLDRIADSNASVLIAGETGTGKELVARALHERGRRKAGPFVAVDCVSLPEPLLESELFGHARGAFTDAHAARKGLFVQANGGALFLDEIGDLPLALQAKLLRALQTRCVRPVGANEEVPFDVNLIAATNRDLESAVEEGRFREDLYFRSTSSTATPRKPASASPGSRPRPRSACSPMSGPATCASSRTASSGRSPSRGTRRSASTISRRRSAASSARTCWSRATIRPSWRRSRRSSAATSCV